LKQFGPFALEPGRLLHYVVYFFAGVGIGEAGSKMPGLGFLCLVIFAVSSAAMCFCFAALFLRLRRERAHWSTACPRTHTEYT
jgi:hypothetical protein